MSDTTLKALLARIEALENPVAPEAPALTVADLRKVLDGLIVGQKESLRIAEEGADYVDAVALTFQAKSDEASAYWLAAHEHIQGLSGDERKRAEKVADNAMRTDEVVSDQARDAVQNAKRWRAAVVPSAKARLAAYEALRERCVSDCDPAGLRAELDAL